VAHLMVVVYLVRHGESTLTKEGILQSRDANIGPLTERGRLEALCAARFIRSVTRGINYIVSSPLLRARETASILAEELNAKVIINDDVREVDMGEWELKRINDIGQPFLDYSRNPLKHPPPGGETAESVLMRMMRVLNSIKEDTIIVSHYQPIASLIMGIVKSDLGNTYRVSVDTGSVSAVFRDDWWGDWRVLFINMRPILFLNCK